MNLEPVNEKESKIETDNITGNWSCITLLKKVMRADFGLPETRGERVSHGSKSGPREKEWPAGARVICGSKSDPQEQE